MAESNATRKAAGLRSPNADAMPVKRSQTSWAGSAPQAAADARSNRPNANRAMSSGPVTGVNPYVALGKIAGPESRRAFTISLDRYADLTFPGIQLLLQVGLCKRRSQTLAAYQDALKMHVRFQRIE